MPAPGRPRLGAAGLLAVLVALGVAPALELRWRRVLQPPRDDWRRVPVRRREGCRLGVSYRPLQARALGLEPSWVLRRLLDLEIESVRVGAYWDRIEREPGTLELGALDATLDAAAQAGKRVVLAVGAVKTFGYPEHFIPRRLAPEGLPEGSVITSASHPELHRAALDFVSALVQRYREYDCVSAWQVENEALDPLGWEHSWRLSREFVQAEVAAVRHLDPGRPVVLNGYVPTSLLARLNQRWRTRGQGDSLAFALHLADSVGLDIYPRNALLGRGGRSLYLSGAQLPWNRIDWRRLRAAAGARKSQLVVTEGQAEPWETTTVPPDMVPQTPYSCGPERLILNYNLALGPPGAPPAVSDYFFWGLEYWLRRESLGDPSYMDAFARILRES
ncbi:MAG: beta-galactosidase [Candidatus Dormibacteria bacterium]